MLIARAISGFTGSSVPCVTAAHAIAICAEARCDALDRLIDGEKASAAVRSAVALVSVVDDDAVLRVDSLP